MTWNTNMDEAPRDGAWFLGYWPRVGKYDSNMGAVCWTGDDWQIDGFSPDHGPDAPIAWMSLPSPPETKHERK